MVTTKIFVYYLSKTSISFYLLPHTAFFTIAQIQLITTNCFQFWTLAIPVLITKHTLYIYYGNIYLEHPNNKMFLWLNALNCNINHLKCQHKQTEIMNMNKT